MRTIADRMRTRPAAGIRVSENIVRLLLRFAARRDLDTGELFQCAGITPEKELAGATFSDADIDALHMALAAHLGEAFALEVGEAMVLPILGSLADVFLHSPNLLQILKIYEESQNMFGNGIRLSVRSGTENVTLALHDFHASRAAFAYRRDGFFSVILSCLKIVSGKNLLPQSVSYTGKLADQTLHRKYFGVSVAEQAATDAMVFRLADLMQKPLFSDPAEFAYLLSQREHEWREAESESVAEKVAKILQSSLPGKLPELGRIAFRLGMGERNLQKYLSQQQVSLRELRNQTICDYAHRRYHDDGQSVAQIAEELGYSEPTVLSRIYRKTTGHTLSQNSQP